MDDIEERLMRYMEVTRQFTSGCPPGDGFDESDNGNEQVLHQYFGDGPLVIEAYYAPSYYRPLLAWTVKQLIQSPGWTDASVREWSFRKPIFSDIQTGYDSRESCLIDGQIFVQRDSVPLAIGLRKPAFVQVEAAEEHMQIVMAILGEIKDFMNKHNFYRGRHLSFDGGISFVNAGHRTWDSVILDPETKASIRLNTTGFLKNLPRLQECGVPPRRGIILAGDPGCGKTVVCKALMSEAENVSCIMTDAYAMSEFGYFSQLFALAQDISPSMVFIEDLDLPGQERTDFYRGTPGLSSLLAEMDGIAEKTATVTVATTNCLEKLDKALSERPSRFDRVFRIPRPDYQGRVQLLSQMAGRIPMSGAIIDYIARQADGFTPAQLQEIPFSLVITNFDAGGSAADPTRQEVDAVISQINRTKNHGGIGFRKNNVE